VQIEKHRTQLGRDGRGVRPVSRRGHPVIGLPDQTRRLVEVAGQVVNPALGRGIRDDLVAVAQLLKCGASLGIELEGLGKPPLE